MIRLLQLLYLRWCLRADVDYIHTLRRERIATWKQIQRIEHRAQELRVKIALLSGDDGVLRA